MSEERDWGWWAGSCDDRFGTGPFPTKEDAIEEALGQGSYEEVQLENGEWKRQVFYAELWGLHFECDECGDVPEACAECKDFLPPSETAGVFYGSRNEGSVLREYED